MNADSTFQIGLTHSVCQDYAIASGSKSSSKELESTYVILSDGCSSSPDTDFGSRLLVRALQQIFRPCGPDEIRELHSKSALLALRFAHRLGLPPESVDATLLTAHASGDELVIGCSGDGVIVLQSRAGAVEAHSVSSPSGFPFYPSYAHQPGRLHAFLANDRACKEIKHYRSTGLDTSLRLVETSTSDSITEVFSFNVADYQSIALISDGILSFFSTRQSGNGREVKTISLVEALRELWRFKTWNGSFVERRVKRFMKECQRKGWYHNDDLAMAAIYLGI